MARLSVPYLKLRNGRPRWEPGPRLRQRGFKDRDLKNDAGQWLGLEAAIAAARELNRQVDEWRLEGRPRRRQPVPKSSGRTCRALFDLFRRSPKWAKLAKQTQRDYANKIKLFLVEFGDAPVGAVQSSHLYRWWEMLHTARGHRMANATLAATRAMLSYALPKRLDWIKENPAFRLELETCPPRVVVWTPAEVAHLVATADELHLASVGDAVVLALHTGQRQDDVLTLQASGVKDGRALFRQGKTGARVSVPLTPQLQIRLETIRARNVASEVVELDVARHLVVSESTGRQYKPDHFRHMFAAVRLAAAADMPSIAGKQFLDLRDTAITRLALAGATVPEIRAITGHSLSTVHQVLVHYLALDDAQADAAVGKLKVWMQEEGIAL